MAATPSAAAPRAPLLGGASASAGPSRKRGRTPGRALKLENKPPPSLEPCQAHYVRCVECHTSRGAWHSFMSNVEVQKQDAAAKCFCEHTF